MELSTGCHAHSERLLLSDDLTVPATCRWALEKLYVPQRCGKGTCDAKKRALDNATVSKEMRGAAKYLLSALPPPLPKRDQPMRIVDIGAGLAMYHIFVARRWRGRTEHYIVDRSANGIRGYGSHAGFHRSVLENGSFPFYSSLECARDIALCSGFAPTRWHAVEASSDNVRSLGVHTVPGCHLWQAIHRCHAAFGLNRLPGSLEGAPRERSKFLFPVAASSLARPVRIAGARARRRLGRHRCLAAQLCAHCPAAAQHSRALPTTCVRVPAGTFHYPISTYADAVRTVLKPDTGRLIVTPRGGRKVPKGQGLEGLEAYGFTCRARTWEQSVSPLTVCCVGCRNDSIALNFPVEAESDASV